MISALTKLQNGNLELTITIPQTLIAKTYTDVISQMTAKTEVKGFRKGKAPKKLVEAQADKTKINEEILRSVLPKAYLEAVKEHNLKPILNPQINVISLEEGKDWQIKAVTCQAPEIILGKYKDLVRQELSAGKIWIPGKDKTEKPKEEEDKTAKVFKALLTSISFSVPQILVDEEVNRMLSRLIDETRKLGLTVEQYLSSNGKTIDQIKAEYQKQSEEVLRLEFILSKIADEEKITVSEAEIGKMIEAVPDKKTQESLRTPDQQTFIRHLIRKRKVVDLLLTL